MVISTDLSKQFLWFFLRSQAHEEEDIEAEIRNLVLHVA